MPIRLCIKCQKDKLYCAKGMCWNCWSKAYEKTATGYIMRTYRNMKSRVVGIQTKKAHLYKGLPILPKHEFYVWVRDRPEFWQLYREWVKSGYERRLSPSINRIKTTDGYVIGNIEWLTHGRNSGLANHRRGSKKTTPTTYVNI